MFYHVHKNSNVHPIRRLFLGFFYYSKIYLKIILVIYLKYIYTNIQKERERERENEHRIVLLWNKKMVRNCSICQLITYEMYSTVLYFLHIGQSVCLSCVFYSQNYLKVFKIIQYSTLDKVNILYMLIIGQVLVHKNVHVLYIITVKQRRRTPLSVC